MDTETVTDQDMMTVAEAAEAIGITERTVQYRLKLGRLPGTNIGGRLWLIPRAAVMEAARIGPLNPGWWGREMNERLTVDQEPASDAAS